jgi:hypothetical protein
VDAIIEDNDLAGPLRCSQKRFFVLGEKTFSDLPPIRVCLSLRNYDAEWFGAAFQQAVRHPHEPAILLTPCWLPISNDIVKQADAEGVSILFLEDFVSSAAWELPWRSIRQKLKKGIESSSRIRVPNNQISPPAGTRWRDITIEMTDNDLDIEVKGVKRVLSYQDAGFENMREHKPRKCWGLLSYFAIRGGVLIQANHVTNDAEYGRLKTQISGLRSRIKALITNIDGNPIPRDGSGGIYRTAFKIS